MKNFKVVQSLKTLNEYEIKSFEKYLKGAFSEKKKVILFFDSLMKYYPHFEINPADERKITKSINSYSNLDWTNTRKDITNLAYKLNTILTEFFVTEQLKEETYRKNILLLKSYIKRKDPSYKTLLNNIEKELRDIPYGTKLDESYLLKLYELNKIKTSIDINELIPPNDLFNLEPFDNTYYIVSQLRYSVRYINKYFLYEKNYSYNRSYFNSLLKRVEMEIYNKTESDIVSLNSIYEVYSLLLSRDRQDFEKSLFFIQDRINHLPNEDKQNCIIYIINYLKFDRIEERKRLSYDLNYFLEIGIRQDVLLNEKGYKLLSEEFINIISVALEYQQFDWVERFIERTSQKNLFDFQIIQLALSHFYLYMGDKEKAFDIISPLFFDKVILSIERRAIEIKILYTICIAGNFDYSSILEAKLESFRKYLERKKWRRDFLIDQEILYSYINFIKSVKKLFNRVYLRNIMVTSAPILKDGIVPFKNWLIAKEAELISKN